MSDEIVVIDAGSTTTRVGFECDEGPRATFPTPKGVIQGGFIADWAGYQALLDDCFRNKLCIEPSEGCSLLLTEPPLNPPADRARLAELVFRTFGFYTFYLAPAPLLQAMSTGRQTAVVVDVGAYVTRMALVIDLCLIKESVAILDVGREIINSVGQMESLFNPSLVGKATPGIHRLVNDAIRKGPADRQGELYRNVVLAGGGAVWEGIDDRMRKELLALGAPATTAVVPDLSNNRHLAAWLGGAFLPTLKGYVPMQPLSRWMLANECQERGGAYINVKLP